MKKTILCALLVVLAMTCITGCDKYSFERTTSNAASDLAEVLDTSDYEKDPNVIRVKNMTNKSYPGKTVGEAFEEFFSSPKWKYYKGTKEGPDEDGDGKADETEDDIDVVEFTGYCTYSDVKVKALIQFSRDETTDTYSATYLSFNEVPQNMLTLNALIAKVFSDSEESDNSESSSELNDSESSVDYSESSVDYDDDDSYLPEPEATSSYPDFYEMPGKWWDSHSQRCNITISQLGNETLYAEINWSGGASINCTWSFSGKYDAENGIFEYYNCQKVITEYNGDLPDETYEYTDGTGKLYFGDDGILYWSDDQENAGETCTFEKNTQ